MDEKAGERRKAGAGDRASHLLDRGLELYTAGDLLGALAEWDAALALDPNLTRAQEYVDYVREHFDALTDQFRAARDAERNAAAQGVPVMDVPEDPDAYDSMDIETAATSSENPPVEIADELAALDAGLDQALEAPSSPPGRAAYVPDYGSGYAEDTGAEAPALEMEAMAPDEDVPGMAPELEGVGLDVGASGDDEATIDVRSPHRRRDYILDDVFDDLPPPGSRPGIMTIQPRSLVDEHETLGLPHSGSAPIVLDDEPAGATMRHEPPRVRPATPSSELMAVGLDDHDEHDEHGHDEDEATGAYDRRRGPGPAATPASSRQTFSTYDPEDLPTARRQPLRRDDYPSSEMTLDYDDGRAARENSAYRDEDRAPTGRIQRVTRERVSAGGPGDSSVIIDERLLRGAGAGVSPAPGRGDPDRTSDYPRRPPSRERDVVRDTRESGDLRASRDSREEGVLRRISDLLRQAEDAAQKGDFLKAVTAVETAATDDEEGSVAPVLLHRHRDLLYRIYEGHIGDMRAVPLVAVPLHEIASKSLDHRTGFLLSRIDGMLTFEDILDVAGMPRMEAYQILSTLLRKGVIEVR